MGSIALDQYTILRAFDAKVAANPNELYCVHPVSSDVSTGWKEVSFGDVDNAVNYTVAWIREHVNPTAGETIAYMGVNDIRYAAFVFACMRLRVPALLLSPRNSEQASRHVLASTGCSKFVYTPDRSRQIEKLTAADPAIQAWEVAGLWEVFSGTKVAPPSVGASDDPEDRVAIIIHSSGTTGLPKPVPMTNGYFNALETACKLPTPEGRVGSLIYNSNPGKRMFVNSPFFHLMGLFNLIVPIIFSTPFVLSPDTPLTVDLLAQIITDTRTQTAILPPSLIDDLSATDVGMETLKKFDMIAFGGAPLSEETGDRVSTVTHVQTVLGSSECGLFASLKHQDPKDWRYFEWNPLSGIVMRDIGDGVHELVLPHGESRDAHPIWHTYPEKTEYVTGDLFVQHAEKEGLWLYQGRMDDVIVLSNGEKFNPTTMEEIIASHPLVARSAVIGQGRFQSAALIEPDWTVWTGEPNALIDEIWPIIEKANETAPGYARLIRDRIGVSSSDKPFKLTPKGSVQRRTVLSDYAAEIDALYEKNDQAMDVAELANDATRADVETYITAAVSDILSVPSIEPATDIFALGLDSLQTLRLGQILQGSLRTARPDLTSAAFNSQQLYSRPTIAQLSDYVYSLLKGESNALATAPVESDSDREARIADLVGKYSDDLGESHAVILTGTTGSLGAYLLHELLRDPTVSKIYCLNRSADAAPRQLQSLHEKGLATFKEFPRRVEFLQAQFGSERLGLEQTKYDQLLTEVDTIIHNAWKVNFNHRVEAFEEPHIQGVRRLVDFSIASEHNAHIHFVSSISTIEGYSPEKGPSIPEVIFTDPTVALRQGYGESKHVSERICAAASAKCGVPTSIHRVGQIGGPTTEAGMWNKQEWLPSLVATSKTIKQIPATLGSVSVQWVPVDVTAKVITDIVRTRRTTQEAHPTAAFHLVNPQVADWPSLIPAVTKYYEDIQPVPLNEWINTLNSFSNPTEDDLKDKPALKIIDFFQAIASVEEPGPWTETAKTQEASRTLKELKAIDEGLMENWMKQWKF